MSLSFFIVLSLITWAHTSTTARSNGKVDNGQDVVYAKGMGLNKNMVASYSTMTHPTDRNVKVIITRATDGQDTLVKTVYDSNGEMLDCDVDVNEDDVQQFVNEAESFIDQKQLKSKSDPHADLKLTVALQAARCEEFLQKVATQSIVQNGQSNPMPVDLEDENAPETRRKRSYLIWPGTNWCGKGSKAEFAQSYGEHAEADQCCQKHDQCPYIIEGFTTKYNLFNYRIHTLSDCECDIKFMECLKSANTSTATMVAKVYFNVVNTECFDLKLQKTCAKRSWWGGCEKYKTNWSATVRTLGTFPEQ